MSPRKMVNLIVGVCALLGGVALAAHYLWLTTVSREVAGQVTRIDHDEKGRAVAVVQYAEGGQARAFSIGPFKRKPALETGEAVRVLVPNDGSSPSLSDPWSQALGAGLCVAAGVVLLLRQLLRTRE